MFTLKTTYIRNREYSDAEWYRVPFTDEHYTTCAAAEHRMTELHALFRANAPKGTHVFEIVEG